MDGTVDGFRDEALAAELAGKLGVTEDKVTEALRGDPGGEPSDRPGRQGPAHPGGARRGPGQGPGREAGRRRGQGHRRPWTEIRTARQAERAAALKERLDAAVADGTLTQAEADAVTKAVEKGVISGRTALTPLMRLPSHDGYECSTTVRHS